MGYLYRPMLKAKEPNFTPTPEDLALSRGDGTDAHKCHHPAHGRAAVCPGCGARFGKVWWAKYYVNGKATRESTETEKETEARRFLKDREGKAATGQPVLPRLNRILYEETAEDLRRHYQTTGERDQEEAEGRLAHLDAFFHSKRIASIGPADVTRYIAARQVEGAANGTVNRELAVLGRMLRLAYDNGKLLRLPLIHKLKEAAPRAGFFERSQFEAVDRSRGRCIICHILLPSPPACLGKRGWKHRGSSAAPRLDMRPQNVYRAATWSAAVLQWRRLLEETC